MDSIFWSHIPGTPYKMKWPVKVVKWEKKPLVFCRCDNAYVSMDQMIPFPGNLDLLKSKGVASLKKQKATLEMFLQDIVWAQEEVLNTQAQLTARDRDTAQASSTTRDQDTAQARSTNRDQDTAQSKARDRDTAQSTVRDTVQSTARDRDTAQARSKTRDRVQARSKTRDQDMVQCTARDRDTPQARSKTRERDRVHARSKTRDRDTAQSTARDRDTAQSRYKTYKTRDRDAVQARSKTRDRVQARSKTRDRDMVQRTARDRDTTQARSKTRERDAVHARSKTRVRDTAQSTARDRDTAQARYKTYKTRDRDAVQARSKTRDRDTAQSTARDTAQAISKTRDRVTVQARSAARDQDITQSTVRDQDTTHSTVQDQDITQSTVQDQYITQSTVRDQDINKSTVGDQDMTQSTARDQDITQSTAQDQDTDTTQYTVRDQDITQARSAARDQNMTQSTVRDQDMTQARSAARDQDMTQSTVRDQDITQSTAQDQDTTQSTVRDQDMTKARSAARDQDMTQSTARDQDTTQYTERDQDITQSTAQDQDTTQSTVRDQDMTQTRSAARDQDLTQSTAQDQDTTQSTVRDQDMTKARFAAQDQDMTQSTARDQDTTQYTVRDQDITQSTAQDQDTTQSTVRDQDMTQTRSAARDQDLTQSTARDQDITQSTVRDQDMTKSTVRDQDMTMSTARDHNITQSTVRDQDMTMSTARDHDITQSTVRDQDIAQAQPEARDQDISSGSDSSCVPYFNYNEQGRTRSIERGCAQTQSTLHTLPRKSNSVSAVCLKSICVIDSSDENSISSLSSDCRKRKKSKKCEHSVKRRKINEQKDKEWQSSKKCHERVKRKRQISEDTDEDSNYDEHSISSSSSDCRKRQKLKEYEHSVKRRQINELGEQRDKEWQSSKKCHERVKRKRQISEDTDEDSHYDEHSLSISSSDCRKRQKSKEYEHSVKRRQINELGEQRDKEWQSSKKCHERVKRKRQISEDSDEGSVCENSAMPSTVNKQKRRDINNDRIFVRKLSSKLRKKKHVYDQVHSCKYCQKILTNISKHYKKHKKEKEVMEILKLASNETTCADESASTTNDTMCNIKRKQRAMWDILRNEGDHINNMNVLNEKGEGEIIISRRQHGQFDSTRYGPCPLCYAWIKHDKTMFRHQTICPAVVLGAKEDTYHTTKELRIASLGISGRLSTEASALLKSEVLPIMTNDEITSIALSDKLIVALGNMWMSKNIGNRLKRKYYTSSRMRGAARLLLNVRKLTGEEDVTMHNILTVSHFDDVVRAALMTASPQFEDIEDIENLKSPSVAIKLGYDIKRLLSAKWGNSLKEKCPEDKCESKNFFKLMEFEWSIRVTRLASTILQTRKFNKENSLPEPMDLVNLQKHIKSELKRLRLTHISDDTLSTVRDGDATQARSASQDRDATHARSAPRDRDTTQARSTPRDRDTTKARSTPRDQDMTNSTVRNQDMTMSTVPDQDMTQSTVRDQDITQSTVRDQDITQSTVRDQDTAQTQYAARDRDTAQTYRRACELAESRLLLYNKRRAGEIEGICVKDYVKRKRGVPNVEQSMHAELSTLEKHMLETQELLETRGKYGRGVPVVIPADLRDTLAYLSSSAVRSAAGVEQSNRYLFPNSRSGVIRAYDSLKKLCSEIDLLKPAKITSVNLRKYTATICQEQTWLVNHLGHTIDIHKLHYRQTSSTIERVEISKLMLLQEYNLSAKYAGKSLKDINLSELVFDSEKGEIVLCSDQTDEDVAEVDVLLDVEQDTEYIPGFENSLQEDHDEFCFEDDEEEEHPQKKKRMAGSRRAWTPAEEAELQTFFNENIETLTTPGHKQCIEAINSSKSQNGLLCRRGWETIKKKVWNIIQKKKRTIS